MFIALLIFGKPIITGKWLVVFDEFDEAYPLQKYFFDSIKSGIFPLWNPYILSGYPLISQTQASIFYPLTWLLLILPYRIAANTLLTLPYVLSAFFTYLYCREIKCSRIASILSGLTFAYSGYLIGHFSYNLGVTHTAIWLPVILFFVQKAIYQHNWIYLSGSALGYGLAVLAGHGQIFVYTALLIIGYGIYMSYIQKRFFPIVFCSLTIFLGGLLASIQILPSFEALQLSIRSKLSYAAFSAGSLNLPQILKAILVPITISPDASIFVLPVSLFLVGLLVIVIFTKRNHLELIHNQLVIFWGCIAFLALLLIAGRHTPLYRLLYLVPPYNLFRGAFRNSFEFCFALSILAGIGFDIVQNQITKTLQWKWSCYLGTIILSIIFIFLCLSSQLAMQYSLWFLMLKFILAGSIIRLLFSIKKPAIQLGLILIFLFEPTLYLKTWFIQYSHTWLSTYTELPLVKFLRSQCPVERYRYLPYNFFENLPQNTRVFGMNLPNLIAAGSIAGVEPVMLKRYDQLLGNNTGTIPPSIGSNTFSFSSIFRNHQPLLNLLNTKYALIPHECENLHFEYPDGTSATGRTVAVEIKPTYISRVDVVSYLSNAVEIAQNEPVANIYLTTTQNQQIKKTMRAGVDTAEWAADRPDVTLRLKHQKTAIQTSFLVASTYQGHIYRTSFKLDTRSEIKHIEFEFIAPVPQIGIHICDILGYDASIKQGKRFFIIKTLIDPIWQKITTISQIEIYENRNVLPRAWLVSQVKSLPAEEIWRTIYTGKFDDGHEFNPHNEALIEREVNLQFEKPTQQPSVNIIKYVPNKIELETFSLTSSFLVLSEIDYPGWKAFVNGKEQQIYQTNYILRGLILPPGNNRIQFIYQPVSFRVGFIISSITFIVLMGMIVINFLRRKE
ncbi:MAG: YfhO family protein [bacterium]|nr:YfhO family protein [bacterium]